MKRTLKRRWPWLFTASLLVVFFVFCRADPSAPAIITEKPRVLVVNPKKDVSETNEVWAFAWSPDSKAIAVNGGIFFRIVNAPSGKAFRKIPLKFQEERSSFQFTPDSKSIRFLGQIADPTEANPYEAELDELIVATGRFKQGNWKRTFPAGLSWGRLSTNHTGEAVSPDGKLKVDRETKDFEDTINFLYTKTYALKLREKKSGKLLHTLYKGEFFGRFSGTQFADEGRLYFALIPKDGDRYPNPMLYGWQVTDGKEVVSLSVPNVTDDVPVDADITPNGKIVALFFSRLLDTGSRNKSISFYDLQTQKLIQTIQNPDVICVAQFSPDGNYLAVGGANGTLTLWHIK